MIFYHIQILMLDNRFEIVHGLFPYLKENYGGIGVLFQVMV